MLENIEIREIIYKFKLSLILKTAVFLIVIGSFSLIVGLVYFWKSNNTSKGYFLSSNESLNGENNFIENDSKIYVDVSGAVLKPDVYQVNSQTRIKDVINLAGGFDSEADTVWIAQKINMAQIVTDGMKIYIPSKIDTIKGVNIGTNLISINSATIKELETLSGIGPSTSQKIVNGRPYSSTEELVQKKIVGTKVWEQIRDMISL